MLDERSVWQRHHIFKADQLYYVNNNNKINRRGLRRLSLPSSFGHGHEHGHEHEHRFLPATMEGRRRRSDFRILLIDTVTTLGGGGDTTCDFTLDNDFSNRNKSSSTNNNSNDGCG